MKKVIKNVISVIAFIIVFTFLFNGVTYVMRPHDQTASKENMSGFYALERDSLDVAAIGASGVYRFFAPSMLYDEYGYTAYAVSFAGQRGTMIKYHIEEILKTQSPELFIIDLRWYANNQQYKEPSEKNLAMLRKSTDNMNNSINRFMAVADNTKNLDEDVASYYFDIIKYHGRWKDSDFKITKEDWLNKKVNYGLGGLMAVKSKDMTKRGAFDGSDIKQAAEISDYCKNNIDDLLSYIESKDINVLFTFTPYSQSENKLKINNGIAEYIKSKGYDVLNANHYIKEIGIDFKTDYYNINHTNILGAMKYTEFLGNYIHENYDIDNTHTDTTHKFYKKAVNYFEQEKQRILTEMKEGK